MRSVSESKYLRRPGENVGAMGSRVSTLPLPACDRLQVNILALNILVLATACGTHLPYSIWHGMLIDSALMLLASQLCHQRLIGPIPIER